MILDFTKDFNKNFTENFTKDFTKEFTYDFTKNFTENFIIETESEKHVSRTSSAELAMLLLIKHSFGISRPHMHSPNTPASGVSGGSPTCIIVKYPDDVKFQ